MCREGLCSCFFENGGTEHERCRDLFVCKSLLAGALDSCSISFCRLAPESEIPQLAYKSHLNDGPLLEQLERLRNRDLALGFTSHGIHKDDLEFTDNEEDDGCYLAHGPLIDLDEYILGILLANVPVRIVKKGAKLPGDGQDYRVISEDQYVKEKENSVDHRWDALDNLELPEDK